MTELEIKITRAMERIEQLYHETDGKCFLSFSGGKDSTVILALIKMCEEIYTIPKDSIKAVFCNTGIELGTTIDFINWIRNNYYSNIEIIRPMKPFASILSEYGKPIKSKNKSEFISRYQQGNRSNNTVNNLFGMTDKVKKIKIADKDLHILHDDFDIRVSNKCCEILKKKPFVEYMKDHDYMGCMLGERMVEGGARELNAKKRLNSGGKVCTRIKGKYIVKLPIVDWTNEDIELFIAEYNVPLSKAYTEQGYDRTGCFLCPYSLRIAENLQRLYVYEPNRYKASMYWLKDVYIAQNVKLPFDPEYEKERVKKWEIDYFTMRKEMLEKYRPKAKCRKSLNDIEVWKKKQ